MIECRDQDRPLFRNEESGGSVVVNNRLTGISDTARLREPSYQIIAGLEKPLKFACGVNGEVLVLGWKTTRIER